MSDDIGPTLEALGVRLLTIEFTPEEKLKIEGWREGIEKYGQELWTIYHWIVRLQGGSTSGIYRLKDWLEQFGVPDNTKGAHWPLAIPGS
jgi:hypothetical protein